MQFPRLCFGMLSLLSSVSISVLIRVDISKAGHWMVCRTDDTWLPVMEPGGLPTHQPRWLSLEIFSCRFLRWKETNRIVYRFRKKWLKSKWDFFFSLLEISQELIRTEDIVGCYVETKETFVTEQGQWNFGHEKTPKLPYTDTISLSFRNQIVNLESIAGICCSQQ